jgi:flagellar biosynthesis/type III secretory pathway protein FliH
MILPGQASVRPSRLMKAGDVATHTSNRQAELAEAAEARLQAVAAEAYAQGLADGRAAEGQESAAAIVRAAEALQQIADDTARLSAEQIDVTEAEMFTAVLELTRWVLRCEPSQASRSLLDRLSHAARTLAPAPTAVVRVSGADIDAVRGWARSGVEVVADARLAPGEARLDRGEGSAVLTFSAALRRAAETFGFDPGILTPAPSGPA